MSRGVIAAALGLAVFGLAACGSSGEDTITEGSAPALAGVGRLPAPLTDRPGGTLVDPTTTNSTVPRSTIVRDADLDPVGDRVGGNRLLIIGDSITASTARRYGGEMCFVLLPEGWAVEVNAEVGRFVDFGARVLDRRLRPDDGVDWDAAVVFLGSNYGGDVERYRAGLHEILDRLAPRPTVLVTVTEFRPDRADVNDVIRGMLAFYPEVEVLDWAEITGADRTLLSGDGLHLSPDGRARLALEVADIVGAAPPGPDGAPPDGECLSTTFTDDSAGQRPGAVVPPTLTGGGGGGGAAPTTPTTTTRPVPPGGSATTAPPRPTTSAPAPPTTMPAAPVPSVTAAPTTAAPTTAAATTAPPTTAPATTTAPVTAPPSTDPPPASTSPATNPADTAPSTGSAPED